MGFFTDLFISIWNRILDNKGKVTSTGGFLLGVIVTLTFKDLYPDLEQSFQRRLRHIRGRSLERRPLPGQANYVRLEDHTRRKSSLIGLSQNGQQVHCKDVQDNEIPVGIEGLIGDTPLIKLKSLSEATGCEIFAKCEYLNGAGNSPKDRVALSIINQAEAGGLLVPYQGDTVYEGTVGSTGISLAAVCRARGYRAYMCVITKGHRHIMILY